jgi:hypothetical protein
VLIIAALDIERAGEGGGTQMRLRSQQVLIVTFLMAGPLLIATEEAAAATAEATVNSINAAGVGARLGTGTFTDTAGGGCWVLTEDNAELGIMFRYSRIPNLGGANFALI